MFYDQHKLILNTTFSLDQNIANDPNWDIDPNNFHRQFTMTDSSKAVHILE